MLIFVALAEAARLFIEHIPTIGILIGAPIAIIVLGIVAVAVATLIDQQLPANKPKESALGREVIK